MARGSKSSQTNWRGANISAPSKSGYLKLNWDRFPFKRLTAKDAKIGEGVR